MADVLGFRLGNTITVHMDKITIKQTKNPQKYPAISCLHETYAKERKSGHRKARNDKMKKNVLGKYEQSRRECGNINRGKVHFCELL